MKLTLLNMQGSAAGEVEVAFPVIENGRGTQAVHDAVVAHLASRRRGTASTKTMGEVAGTGKKPWRQKGTGRARAGSFQSPLWRGGGVVFGPKPRDFSKQLPRQTRLLALRKALSERLKAGDVLLVEDLALSAPKTKGFVSLLKNLNVDQGSALVVCEGDSRNLLLASRNVPRVALTSGTELSTYQVLQYDKLVFTRAALEKVAARLQPS